MPAADWGDVYKELGAVPVINATGSVTMLGGCTPVPEVTEAIPTPFTCHSDRREESKIHRRQPVCP